MAENSDYEARRSYALRIVALWLESIDFAQEAQKYFLRGETENDVTLEYVARLGRLWKELVPKVTNRVELKDLKNEYMSFEPYVLDPRKLLTDPSKIYELETVICNLLDKLGLTLLENIK